MVYVLIGPKGGGKSYVGRLLEREFGIKFLAIEEIFINLQGKGISTPDVQARGYKIVEERISEILAKGNDAVSFEITVLTPSSRTLLEQLGQRSQMEMIQIYARPPRRPPPCPSGPGCAARAVGATKTITASKATNKPVKSVHRLVFIVKILS